MLTLFREDVGKRRGEVDMDFRLTPHTECHCAIQLDGNYSEIRTNFDRIKGKVHICLLRSSTSTSLPSFKSLRIQLEGIVTTMGCPNGISTKLRHEHQFLPLEAATDSPSLSSLCYHFVKSSKPTLPLFRCHGKSHHSFPFEIFLTGQNLPASFKNDFFKIEYLLVVYSCLSGDMECVSAQKTLTTKGCLNLSKNPSLFKPWTVTRRQKRKSKSIFYKRQAALKAHLMLQKRGYLPGDNLHVKLEVENPMCDTIRKLGLTLVQRIIYFSYRERDEIKSTVLAQQEYGCDLSDGEIRWDCAIRIPDNLMPSFTRNTCLGIIYVVQFAVELADNGGGLTGETLIVIGTMLDDNFYREERALAAAAAGPSSRSRGHEDEDDFDTISIQTCSTLPPSYSNLTSRQPSLETLPPAYDDIMELDPEDNPEDEEKSEKEEEEGQNFEKENLTDQT